MRTKLFTLILLLITTVLFAQAPVVSNVSFSQRTDGSLIVDIYYDLADSDGETKEVIVEASSDNGATWTLTCTSLTGDVGSGVTLGTGKHVIWDFYADNPNTSGSSYKIRVSALETGTMTGNDGRVYNTVKIGDQWWMSENLRETKYRDGSTIATKVNNTDWAAINIGAYCPYDQNESYAGTYGYLYNWAAVTHSANIAPAGWHVPTDAEWTTLTTYLGGESVAGGKMKETGTSHWVSPNTDATNESGFSGLPGGHRHYYDGCFYGLGSYATFWSASESSSSSAWSRILSYSNSAINRSSNYKTYGFSLRLVMN